MQKLSAADCVEIAAEHYELYRPYLSSYQLTVTNSSNRAGAKDKLQRMSNVDFITMSIDVYDELKRRKQNSPDVPFLPVNPNLPPNKNGARQKLATLAISRFHLLCSDVMNEIAYRFPQVVSRYNQKYGEDKPTTPENRSTATPSIGRSQTSPHSPPQRYDDRGKSMPANPRNVDQSNTFNPQGIPRQSSRQKSTERDRYPNSKPPPMRNPSSSNNSRNQIKVLSNDTNKQSLDNLMSDLGNMMGGASPDQGQMDEWNRQKQDYESQIRELRARVESEQNSATNSARVDELERELESYREEKKELETLLDKMTQDYEKVKEEYEYLQDDYENQKLIANDIRTEASNLLVEIKNLSQLNDELHEENRQLKADLAKGGGGSRSNDRGNGGGGDDGLIISKERIDAFQSAMSDFLNCASGDENNTSVLVAMKSIVIACRNITEDSQPYADLGPARDRVSDCLGELMNAAKAHATNLSESTAEMLEEPAAELTQAVFDLVDSLNSTDVAMSLDELKNYLENQTDNIVQAIQSLLLAMRKSSTFGQDFLDIVSGITDIVNDILLNSKKTLNTCEDVDDETRNQGDLVCMDLQAASRDLKQLGDSMVNGDSANAKTLKQKMASSSYEIAKYVKELVNLIE